MKKLKFKSSVTPKLGIISAFAALTLVSCQLFNPTVIRYDYPLKDVDEYLDVDTLVYHQPAVYTQSFSSVYRSSLENNRQTRNLPSTGTQKILVIPVDFQDFQASRLKEGSEDSLTIIENAFFGNESTNQWESVASFYHKSSYGKLNLTGQVSSWFTVDENYQNLKSISGLNKVTTSQRILRKAINWYAQKYDNLSDFDQDQDGYIDAVYLVYAPPYGEAESLFWAFSSFDLGSPGNLEKPTPNAYAWSSFSFLNNFLNKPDTHTLIHEVGHIFGLDDYYNTRYKNEVVGGTTEEEKYQFLNGPTGSVDIMDYSLGDHSAYSKMLLNWTRPFYITGEGEITLNSFVQSGEVAIIAPEWNGSAMDEYIAVEYYTPTGLNAFDASGLLKKHKLMNEAGLKIYHVDARVGVYSPQNSFLGYANDFSEAQLAGLGRYILKIAHTNTFATTINGNILYHLLESNGENSFLLGKVATNKTLFKVGNSFGLPKDPFANFTFHNGQTLPFGLSIKKINNDQITLTIKSR